MSLAYVICMPSKNISKRLSSTIPTLAMWPMYAFKMTLLLCLVRFLSDFFIITFFMLNVFYLGYEILLQSFVQLRYVVIELCEK